MRLRLAFCALLLVPACGATASAVRLHPEAPNVVWRSGRGIVEKDVPGARVALAFDRQDSRRLVFRLEVQNTGEDRVEIDPRQMTFVACVSVPHQCVHEQPVIDPEAELANLDRERSSEEHERADRALAGLPLLLLSPIVAIAATGAGDDKSARRLARESRAERADDERADARTDRRLSQIAGEKLTWEAAALRRTTLFPGEGLAGEVYVPTDREATALWVGVRVRGERSWFPFRQAALY
jgi:hypothetical protein